MLTEYASRVRPRSSAKKACNTAERHQTERAVGSRTGRAQRKRGPSARVGRQVGNRRLVDVRRKVRLFHVDDRGGRRHLDGLNLPRHAQGDIEIRRAADFDDDVVSLVRRKATQHDLDRIDSRLQSNDEKASIRIGDGLRRTVGADVPDGYGGSRHAGLLDVEHDAADGSLGGGLRKCGWNTGYE